MAVSSSRAAVYPWTISLHVDHRQSGRRPGAATVGRMFTSRTVPTLIATALLAVGMSSAALAQQDLRSPDTRDAAIAATQKQDLRSPDSRDAARADQIARQMRRFAAAQ